MEGEAVSSFDPFGWVARYIPERRLHQILRAGGVILFGVFLVLRIRQYPSFLLKPLWVAETAIFAALLLAYLIRTEPRERSQGVNEILVPLAAAALPFALLTTPPSLAITAQRPLLLAVFWAMTLSSVLTAWGIWTLRRSFSITVEARDLVTGGPYRWVRHPVYLGEVLSAAVVTAWRPSLTNVALLVLFAGLQLYRSRLEERKLARVFPEAYPSWAQRTWWLWRER
jgi:protein-S-isoprenylcysteine O-methyltransferase Ste14